jgi:hypothetical protein
VHAVPIGGRAMSLVLGDVGGPFDAAFTMQRLVIGQACVDGDASELRIRSCDTRGERAQTHRVPATPPDARLRRRLAMTRNVLDQVVAGLASVGYRGGSPRTLVAEQASRAVVAGAEGADVIELVATDDGAHLRIAAMDTENALVPPRVLRWETRLGRWIRERLRPALRQAAIAEQAWGEALVGAAGTGVEVVRAGGVLVVSAELSEIPAAEQVLQWIANVRARRREVPAPRE